MTARSVALAAALAMGAPAVPASAQFSDPCDVACALVLSTSAYTVAIGAVVAYGRASGGYSTRDLPLAIWSTSFVAVAGSGIALSGNGERQQRAVFGSGIGAAAGALTGLALSSALGDREPSERLSAVLIGAAAGTLIGGVYGALSHDERGGAARPARIGIRIAF